MSRAAQPWCSRPAERSPRGPTRRAGWSRRLREDLGAAVPGLDERGDLVVREVMNVGSYVITPEQMFIIASAAREAAAERGVAGVVVTHGTDTMEETAYRTDLLHTGAQPIVFTGAQRHADAHDADGPRNVLDAVRISRSPAASGIGAVIAMAGRIDGAREATKLHTFALEAFGSFEHGRLGEVRDRDVHVYHPRVRPDNLSQIDRIEPKVALIN